MCGCQWLCSALTSRLAQRVTVTPLVLSLDSPANPSVGLAPARQGSWGSAVTGASMGSTTSHKMAAEVSRDHMCIRGPVMLCAPSMSNPSTLYIALKYIIECLTIRTLHWAVMVTSCSDKSLLCVRGLLDVVLPAVRAS